MKVFIVLFQMLLIIGACSEKTEEEAQNFDLKAEQQEWSLFKMTGNTPNSETTGNQMSWQEIYEINNNGSFTKIRNRDGNITEASGTYEIKEENEGRALLLMYDQKNPIIGNCTGDTTEYLSIYKDILQSSWFACDGPGLFYKRTK
ncbi:hypothetical protein NBT05_00915 [Aquimarina sp. ERC-38]|uniref:hypothetical protein n=1 Tax=Aquimarina sp. ERC-38 TaxID=2949996 RepID=UPI002246DF4D|nr:hypothetical protein [Aquimarina sp. ERC-38]UZO81052.1 hypothetical protein NBT05_00915 [Aquimarina sp. ERC-38]